MLVAVICHGKFDRGLDRYAALRSSKRFFGRTPVE
jgi:hypothetical protein